MVAAKNLCMEAVVAMATVSVPWKSVKGSVFIVKSCYLLAMIQFSPTKPYVSCRWTVAHVQGATIRGGILMRIDRLAFLSSTVAVLGIETDSRVSSLALSSVLLFCSQV